MDANTLLWVVGISCVVLGYLLGGLTIMIAEKMYLRSERKKQERKRIEAILDKIEKL